MRGFAAKGGPPGQGPPAEPYKRPTTYVEDFVNSGQEFILGAPPQPEKVYNAPRDTFIDKMSPRIDRYALKLRELYHRQGHISH